MRGEITLRGRVLAVGGLKEKILAARQHDIKKIILPKENQEDVEEIIKELGTIDDLIFVDNMDEVLKLALSKNPFGKKINNESSKNNLKKTKKKSKNWIKKP